MRKLLLVVAALFLSPSAATAHMASPVPFEQIGSLDDVVHKAAFGIFQTYVIPPTPQITCNLVTGVASVGGPCTSGATCNGSADTAPAFWQFRTWALANQAGGSNQVVLNIPTGSNCVFNSNAGTVGGFLNGTPNTFVAGIRNLIIDGGAGATLSVGTTGFWLGNYGQCQNGIAQPAGCSARIQSVSAGSSTVTFTAASYAAGYVSRYAVGDPLLIAGLNPQDLYNVPYGYPSNFHYFEHRLITSICNNTGACPGAVVITLDRPLTNSYLDTWPLINSGDGLEADAGGPATIYKLGFPGAEWNSTLDYRNLTIYTTGNQIYTNVRYNYWRNVTFTGAGKGAIPSQNEYWYGSNITWPITDIEIDKSIGTFVCDTCAIHIMDFQSSSVNLFQLSNSTVAVNLVGGGKRTEITDTSITNWRPGTVAYGNIPGPVICTRCNVSNFLSAFGIEQTSDPSPYSMSGGVISFLNTAMSGSGPAQRWIAPVPGTYFFGTNGSSGFFTTMQAFSVSGLTQDATNVYAQTNQAGGFPDYANLTPFAGTRIEIRSSGAPQFTCDACTGDPQLVAYNIQNGATPLAPIATYSKMSYTPSAGNADVEVNYAIGKLVSLTIDVTQAYTGSGAVTLQPAAFLNPTVKQSDWTNFDWMYSINLKQAGTRVITPSGVTCNGSPGGCSGDLNLTVPEAIWLWGGIGGYINGAFSGGVNPQFTITLRTDQTP